MSRIKTPKIWGFLSPAGGESDRKLLGCGIFRHPFGKPYPQHKDNFASHGKYQIEDEICKIMHMFVGLEHF
jgi:hypothetical protein